MDDESYIDQVFLIKLQSIIEDIEENYSHENFGVDELAQEWSISRSYLYWKLHAFTQLFASQLFKKFRLKMVMNLLSSKVRYCRRNYVLPTIIPNKNDDFDKSLD